MLTNRGKYGLKALVHLAGLPEGTSALSADIATANNIPKKFLDAIMLDLKNAGILRSRKGRGGGYALARPAKEIMVGEAIRVLDGALAPIACASRNYFHPCEDCLDVAACAVRLTMVSVRDAISKVLDTMTLEAMAQQQRQPGEALMYYI